MFLYLFCIISFYFGAGSVRIDINPLMPELALSYINRVWVGRGREGGREGEIKSNQDKMDRMEWLAHLLL